MQNKFDNLLSICCACMAHHGYRNISVYDNYHFVVELIGNYPDIHINNKKLKDQVKKMDANLCESGHLLRSSQ